MNDFFAWLNKKDRTFGEDLVISAIKVLPIAFAIRTFIFGLYVVPTGSMESYSPEMPKSHGMFVGERFLADKLTIWFTPIQRGEVISFNDPLYNYSTNPIKRLWQRYVWGPTSWTKRIIGIPGDRVQGRVEDGKPVIYVNGERLHEPYVNTLPLLYTWRNKVPATDSCVGIQNPEDTFGLEVRTFDPSRSYADQIFYRVNPKFIVHGSNCLLDGHYDAINDYWLRLPCTPHAQGYDVFDVQLGDGEYWVMGDNRQNSDDSRRIGKVGGWLIHGRIKYRFWSVQYTRPWRFLFFDETWLPVDILLHPIDFWGRVRWSRCLGKVS